MNPVRDARTPWDEIQNCLRDTTCAAAVNGIATQVGIPANAIHLVNAGAIFTAKAEGEETCYSIPALAGKFVVHRFGPPRWFRRRSDRASLFSISAAPAAVGIYAWTPRQGIGAGGSW
jgi:hypothetical protein